MADLFLNFKDFHHENTDDKSTTLRHKKLGHKITSAHNVLSEKNKAALMAMAKSAKKAQTSDQANEEQSQDSGYGKVIRMAEGGETKQPYIIPAEQRDASPTPPPVEKSKQDRLRDIGHKASGGEKNKPTLDPRSWWAEGGNIQRFAEKGNVEPITEDYGSNTAPPVDQESAQGPYATGYQGAQEPDFSRYNPNQSLGHNMASYVGSTFGKVVSGATNAIGAGKDVAKGAVDAAGNLINTAGEAASREILKGTGTDLSGKDEEQPQGAPAVPGDAASTAEPANVPMAANQAPPIATPPSPMAKGLADTENMLTDAYHNRMNAADKTAAAVKGKSEEEVAALNKDVATRQQAQSIFQDHYNELDQERKALQADIQNGHIDPNKFWTGGPNGEGGHSKIAAGIGMILAGFNPTNSPNAAINFLKYQMDQNLEAQKQNLSSKQNLLSANLRQFGNLKDATEMTRIMQGDILSNELQTAAAKASTPMAKAAALAAQGQLQQEMAPMFQQFALRRAMIGAANGGADPASVDHLLAYARIANPEMAKEMEQRYVPGVGMGKVPVPESVRSQIVTAKTTNDLFNDSLKMAAQPIPNPATHPAEYAKFVGQANTLRNQLIGVIKQQQHDGVYKESEANYLLEQVGNTPASVFRAVKTVPKLQELQKIKQQEYSNMLNTYGIPNQQLPQQQMAHPMEGKTAVNKQGQRLTMKNGRWVPQ